jgi:hypothetical protein
MPWRNWSVIIVLILANYVVFSIIGTLLFPVVPPAAPTHVARPTFTPGVQAPQRVDPLTYDFLTPSPTLTSTPRPVTITPTPKTTVIPTSTFTPTSTN